jgi:hypothetical protein
MFSRLKKKEKVVKGKAPYRLSLFTNNDFHLDYELEIPKDHWALGVIKVEKKLKKTGLKRVDKVWDELPIDSKSVKFIQKGLIKEIIPSVLEKEAPLYKKKTGKKLKISSSQILSIVVYNGKNFNPPKSHNIAKIKIKGIWYGE